MSQKTAEPFVPAEIVDKIQQLKELLEDANDLYNEIFDWYDAELKSYNSTANASNELFDPGTGCVVPGISYTAIMEGLSIVQTFNES